MPSINLNYGFPRRKHKELILAHLLVKINAYNDQFNNAANFCSDFVDYTLEEHDAFCTDKVDEVIEAVITVNGYAVSQELRNAIKQLMFL